MDISLLKVKIKKLRSELSFIKNLRTLNEIAKAMSEYLILIFLREFIVFT